MKRHYRPSTGSLYLQDINPRSAQWKYLSFKVAAISPGRSINAASGTEEIVIVPLSGRGTVSFDGEVYELARKDLFRELADIVYLPPGISYRLEALEAFEMAIGGARADGKLRPRLIRGDEILSSIRGNANLKRGVSALADFDQLTERLTVCEIHTPSGNWSSFPAHRHDTRDNSSYHEETYYYRLMLSDGVAIQRIYTRDTDLEVAIPVQNGDLVLIHEGYHPVVKAPGTNAYCLNFLAGDVRKINPVNDPHFDWLTKNWDGNPIAIPVK